MLCITPDTLKTYQEPELWELYDYTTVLMTIHNCNYAVLLNDDLQIIKSFLYIGNITLLPSKLKNFVFVNNAKYYNCYMHPSTPLQFNSIDGYKEYLSQKVKTIKIVDVTNFSMFTKLEAQSHSQLLNIEIIYKWIMLNKYALKACLNDASVMHYNFYNYVLYMLSRRGAQISENALSEVFKVSDSHQHLSIDIPDNRPITKKGINYLNITKSDYRLALIKPQRGMWLFQFDFVSSYLQLLYNLLDNPMPDEDVYIYLGAKLKLPQQTTRPEIKQRVFQILFSNEIKEHLDIEFFNDMYQFSIYLWEEYKLHGYINSLISGKKMYIAKGERNSRSKLFNMVIMNLQFEVYIGVLYQLLQYKKDKINPIIFVHDSIIMEIDCDKYLQEIESVESIITYNGLFKISRKLGKNLQQMHEI